MIVTRSDVWAGHAPRVLLMMAVACAGIVAAGCIWPMGPGGATPGLFANDTTYPNNPPTDTVREIAYEPGDFEFIGWVQTSQRAANMTGRIPGPFQSLVGLEDNDYASAYEDLRKLHDIDGLLNGCVDTRRWQLNLFFVRVSVYHTVVGGVGYRHRRPLEAMLARAKSGTP